MKTIMKATLSAVGLFLALPACGQTASAPAPAAATTDADPALWVVKDKDTTVYLFGTIHILKPGLTWFDEAVKTAFDRSGELVLEMVKPDDAAMQQLVVSQGLNPTGPTLTEKIPAGDRAAYLKALTDSGVPAAAFDRMKPWLAAVTLSLGPIQKAGYAPANGPEEVLSGSARASAKPVVGLETAAQQIGYFGMLSEPAQLRFLAATIKELPKANDTMARMVADWSRGDPDALAAEMNDALKDSPEVGKVLLTDRNIRWAAWIKERMARPGTVFVAVGAGHLAGPDSVQAQLAKLKIKAKRVKY